MIPEPDFSSYLNFYLSAVNISPNDVTAQLRQYGNYHNTLRAISNFISRHPQSHSNLKICALMRELRKELQKPAQDAPPMAQKLKRRADTAPDVLPDIIPNQKYMYKLPED